MALRVGEDDVRRFVVNGSGNPLATDKSLKDMLDDVTTEVLTHPTLAEIEASTVLAKEATLTPKASQASVDVIDGIVDDILTKLTFQHQADIVLDQASPVQNTWYTVLDTTANVRIISLSAAVRDTNETCETRITIDGQTVTASGALTANSDVEVVNAYAQNDGFGYDSLGFSMYRTFLVEGRSIKIEMRKTTAAGTGNLQSRLKWAKR